MEKIVYFYSIMVIAVCAGSMSPAGILYIRTKKPVYRYLVLLFGCYLLELTELHYIVFVGLPIGQISLEDLNHISYPVFRIGISAVILTLDLLILFQITGRKWKKVYVLVLLPMLTVCTFLVFQPQTELVVWLFYSVRQFYRIGYCAWFGICLFIETEQERCQKINKYTLLIFGVFLLDLCIMLEDSLVISHIDSFLVDIPFISERNFSENFLWMFICIYSTSICLSKIYKAPSDNFGVELQEPQQQECQPIKADCVRTHMEGILSAFVKEYRLTPREAEILECMADYKSVSEICEELYISTGTVKTHTHNIYAKVNVNSKNELIRELRNYLENRGVDEEIWKTR